MNPMPPMTGMPAQRGRLPAVSAALDPTPIPLIVSVFLLLMLATMPASGAGNRGVEHPGSVHADDNCSSCHADKSRGKSVHSAIELSCTVCHLAQTNGDMTTLTLLMPKPKVCFACHEETSSVRQHRPVTKRLCLDCHDAHSSNRRMLLREPSLVGLN
jgi:predicted CXXCH cytochrome family protein